jgi:tetratricopeptide (TPR) repeat protein
MRLAVCPSRFRRIDVVVVVSQRFVIEIETKNRIQAALSTGDFGLASMLAEAALATGQSHQTLYRLAALQRQQVGDLHQAAAFLLKAVDLSPDDPGLLAAAGDSLRNLGQLAESVALFDSALSRDPLSVAAHYGRALALESAGDLEEARLSFKRVSELAPDTAPGFAGLATTNAQLGNHSDARQYATRAYELDANEPSACMALALCEMADGNFANAVQVLRQTPLDQVNLLTLLGDVLDRIGDFDGAFDAYAKANKQFSDMHRPLAAPPSARQRVEDIAEAVRGLKSFDSKVPPERASGQAAHHVFLLGFPRSGTTLVEQALVSLPDVVALEESPTLIDAASFLECTGVVRLAMLPDQEIAALRAAYWKRVTASCHDVTGKTFVDMDPSKSAALPLIATLFPDAKVILMRRDPCDVVWSCFRRAFVANAMTLEFTTMQSTAYHYAAVMSLIKTSLSKLPMDTCTIAYEDLVQDFDQTTRRICDFIGIPWSAAMRNFGSTARLGRVKTASAAQVRGPLFDGAGQWRNYANKLDPVLSILEPWVNAADQW